MTVQSRAVPVPAACSALLNAGPAAANVASPATLARPRWLPESVWPHPLSSLEVDGTSIAYTDVGQGPVPLFVHTGFWSIIWRDVIARLSSGFRCVCLDAPGTGFLTRLISSGFGVGQRFDDAGRAAFLAGIGRQGARSFHGYMRDAGKADALYTTLDHALAGPFRDLPLLTIFGERNDPLGFQPRWKALYPGARQVVVPGGNHFPMCDAPDLVAGSIREWHGERVAPASGRPR